MAVRAFSAHFGDGSCQFISADDEARHDVNDIEIGFIVDHEVLRGTKSVDFGCCVRLEGTCIGGLGRGHVYFVCGNVRGRRISGEGEGRGKKGEAHQ